MDESAKTGTQDEQALEEMGYSQELPRVLKLWTNWALGFAFISPIVGLYTVVALGAQTAGPTWVWTLLVVIAGQFLVALVYTQLAERWPVAGGIYQWSRRLLGPKFGWWAGWIYAWALILTLSTVAFSGGIFLAALVGIESPTTGQQLLFAIIMMLCLTTVNAIGLNLLKWVVNIGIACEIVVSVGIGVALIALFREQPVSVLVDTAMRPEGTGYWSAMLAALAISGWVILGFDACGSVAEETRNAAQHVPRAILTSLITVGIVDVIGAVALVLASPDLQAVLAGQVADPVSATVEHALGGWAAKPFLFVVVVAFLACGIAVQATGVRVVYSFSRDGMLPLASVWRRVSERNRSPVFATLLVATLATLAFLYGNALSVLVAFATGGYYVGFLAPVLALLIVRLKGGWQHRGRWTLGRADVWINLVATLWLVFQFVNIAWPRSTDLPWWQNWGLVLGAVFFVGLGAVYFFAARPDRVLAASSVEDDAPRSSAPPHGASEPQTGEMA